MRNWSRSVCGPCVQDAGTRLFKGFLFAGGPKGKWPNNSEVLDSAQGEISAPPPPPAVPQLRDSHTPRAESAGSEDIFGVPEFQCTRTCSRRTLMDRQTRMNVNSAVEIPESADSGMRLPNP